MNVVLDKLNGSKKAGAGVTRKSAATRRWHLEVGDGGLRGLRASARDSSLSPGPWAFIGDRFQLGCGDGSDWPGLRKGALHSPSSKKWASLVPFPGAHGGELNSTLALGLWQMLRTGPGRHLAWTLGPC